MEDNNPKLQKVRRRADAYVRIMETARILKGDDHHIHTHSQDNTDSIQRMAGEATTDICETRSRCTYVLVGTIEVESILSTSMLELLRYLREHIASVYSRSSFQN